MKFHLVPYKETYLGYEDQQIDAVQRSCSLFWKPYETHQYTLREEFRVLLCKNRLLNNSHWHLRGDYKHSNTAWDWSLERVNPKRWDTAAFGPFSGPIWVVAVHLNTWWRKTLPVSKRLCSVGLLYDEEGPKNLYIPNGMRPLSS
jgi:hypothetical protein